jgi:hypothetical protein
LQLLHHPHQRLAGLAAELLLVERAVGIYIGSLEALRGNGIVSSSVWGGILLAQHLLADFFH